MSLSAEKLREREGLETNLSWIERGTNLVDSDD